MLKYKLTVHRRLSNANTIRVGELAENNSGIYFQYDKHYLAKHSTISGFALDASTDIQVGPLTPHNKLHGVFADSLPDGWGLYLMDRIFRKNGYNHNNISPLERLAFIGDNCLGSLYYEPTIALADDKKQNDISIQELGNQAIKEFEGTETDLVEHLMNTAGSGGARPKINATLLPNGSYTTDRSALGKHCLIKLTSDNFYLKHEESLVEFCCMTLANQCGIETANFELLRANDNKYWLRQDRFDCVGERGRLHMISASGLLDASFREPSLDYIDLVKATRIMCGAQEAKKLIKIALFNYLICNQDDHAKNFAFLCDDKDNWRLSPFYDVVYSPSLSGEHMTAFNGDGIAPKKSSLELMARHAGIDPKEIKGLTEAMMETLSSAKTLLQNVGVSSTTSNIITSTIGDKWSQLKVRT
jgi:serine/threonine-protein kinase HipA